MKKELSNYDMGLLWMGLIIGLGITLCIMAGGCSTMAGIGNDLSDACNGYSIQAGQRAAASQAYQDGLNGDDYSRR